MGKEVAGDDGGRVLARQGHVLQALAGHPNVASRTKKIFRFFDSNKSVPPLAFSFPT